ncbi:MAG: LrgB family protein [Oscillospiraceae bacterium]|jgi:predicted murein hydrolase (TIGR00659 family)
MKELSSWAFLGVVVTLAAYQAGLWLKNKTGKSFVNPIIIGCALVIAFLILTGLPYSVYFDGSKYISYLLTPATVCLAIPLYEQLQALRKNILAILAGVMAGVLTSMLCVLIIALIFGMTHSEYVTFLPKSVTTAIGLVLSEELGGIPSITAALIIVTGVVGNISADLICRLFRIEDPVAKGIAIGTSSHVIGTSRALEIGEVTGAASSLSIVVSGLITVIAASVFSLIL